MIPARPIRVAIVDSGVNPGHSHIHNIAGGAVFVAGVTSWLDVLGHGTAVTAAIQEKAPSAEYFSLKVFHDSFRTGITQLTDAISWAIDKRMDVINLSLGTRNAAHLDRFAELISRAAEAGCLLVSALDSQGEHSYPGALKGVLGVTADPECPREQYRVLANGYACSPYPRSLPSIPKERNLSGISFAVANFTGLVARLRQQHHGSELVRLLRSGTAG